MKNRKMKKEAQKDVKNVKQVTVTEEVTGEYNIEKILEELGVSESNKKSKNRKSKTKADQKRSGKLSNIGKKDMRSGDMLEQIAVDDTTGVAEEDNQELVEESQSNDNSQELISSTNSTVSSELATQAAMLNLQTSQSTEDMFTPVVKKHSKRQKKKAGILNLSKENLTPISSSSAIFTTSSEMATSSNQNALYATSSNSSILSAKPDNEVMLLNVQKLNENPTIVDEKNPEFEFKNQGLHEDLNVTMDQNSKLEGEIQNRNKSNSELECKNQDLNDFLKIAEDQTPEFKYKNQGLHENLNVTLDQISKLEGEIQNCNKSNSELECKNQDLNEFLKIAEDQNTKLEKENQNIKESRLCKICLDKEVSQVFLPCGHSICCNECVVGIQICPICRDWIQKSQTIYFS